MSLSRAALLIVGLGFGLLPAVLYAQPVAELIAASRVTVSSFSFGEAYQGVQLGLCVTNEAAGNGSMMAYLQIRNLGTNTIYVDRFGPEYLVLDGANAGGKGLMLMDSPENRVVAGLSFFVLSPPILPTGTVATVRFNLSRYLRAPESGVYRALVSARFGFSDRWPADNRSFPKVELVSGPVEITVEEEAVHDAKNGWPSSAVARPVSAYFMDVTRAQSPQEREMLEAANASMTNVLRRRWPHILGEAPLGTNATNTATTPLVVVPIAEVETGGTETSRWWTAGAAVAAAAAVGLGILRRSRNRSRY